MIDRKTSKPGGDRGILPGYEAQAAVQHALNVN
jgi:hypothetical protein